MNRKKVLLIGMLILLLIAIPVTVFLIQNRQIFNLRAENSTTLSFVPATESLAKGQEKTFDIEINPGQNLVSLVKLVIDYDASKLEVSGDKLVNNSQLPFTEGPVYDNGKITATLSFSQDATKVIRGKTVLARVTFRVLDNAVESQTNISFDRAPDQTHALSISANNLRSQDVLASANGAVITITAQNACIEDQSSCEWSAVENASSYHYKVTDVGTSGIVKEGDVLAPTTTVTFTSKSGSTYKCEVNAVNSCGNTGALGSGIQTCALAPTAVPTETPVPTATPVPTESPTPTLTPTGTPVPTAIPTPTNTPTPTPTNTPTPTPTNTPTPVPPTPTLTPTETPVPTVTPVPTEVMTSTSTPTTPPAAVILTPTSTVIVAKPSLPPTGNESTTVQITFLGVVLIILGISLFAIF